MSEQSETVRRIVVSEEKCTIFSVKLLDQCLKTLTTAQDISISFNGEVVTLNVDQEVYSFKTLKDNQQATDCFREIEAGRNEWIWEEIGQVQGKLQPQRQLGSVRETVRQKRTEEENWRNQHKSKEFNQSSLSKTAHSLIKKGLRPMTKTSKSVITKPTNTVPNRLVVPKSVPKIMKPLTPTPSTPPSTATTTTTTASSLIPPQTHSNSSNPSVPPSTTPPASISISPAPPGPVSKPPNVPPASVPPSIPNPTSISNSSTPTGPGINNSKQTQPNPSVEPVMSQIAPSSEDDLRRRIIHLLANEELTIDSISSRFITDHNLVQKIVREVGIMNSQWFWSLKDKFFQYVDLDWPDYTPEIREKVRLKKNQKVVEEKKPASRPPPNPASIPRQQRPVTNEKGNTISISQKYGQIPKSINNDLEYKDGCNKFHQIYKDYSKIFEELNINRQKFLEFDRQWKAQTSEEQKQKLKAQIQHEYHNRVGNVKLKRQQFKVLHQTLTSLKQLLKEYARQQAQKQNIAPLRTN